MEDVLLKVAACFREEELANQRSIIIVRNSYIEACKKLVDAEAEAKAFGEQLEETVYGQVERRFRGKPKTTAQRLDEVLVENTSWRLADSDTGEFSLKDTENGFMGFWEIEPELHVTIEADHPRIKGDHKLVLYMLDPLIGKGVLYWSNADEDDVDDDTIFSFAISVDTRQTTDQVVALSYYEGEHYLPTGVIEDYIKQGRTVDG